MPENENTVDPFLVRTPSAKGTVIAILAFINILLLVFFGYTFNTLEPWLLGFPLFFWLCIVFSLLPVPILMLAMHWKVAQVDEELPEDVQKIIDEMEEKENGTNEVN